MHAALSDDLVARGFHLVALAGPLMKHLHAALPSEMRGPHVMESKQLMPLLAKLIQAGDYVLVKGSHGSKMYEIATALTGASLEKKHAV